MKKIILLILMLTGFITQAQNTYFTIFNTPTTGGRFVIPTNTAFDMTAAGPNYSRTITFRIKGNTTNPNNFGRIFQKGDSPGSGTSTGGYGLTFGTLTSTAHTDIRTTEYSSDSPYANYGNTSNSAIVFTALHDGNWHHVTVVYNDMSDAVNNSIRRAKVYFDGVFLSYASNSGSPKTGPINNISIADIIFGSTSSGGSIVNESIDDIRIWDHSFTPAEVITDLTAVIDATNAPTYPGLLAAYDFEASTIDIAGGVPDITTHTSNGQAVVGLSTGSALVSGSSLPKYVWLGTADTSWTNTANWSGGVVPTATSDVIIGYGAVNQPTLSATTTINSLAVQAGTTLTVSAPNLTVTKSVAILGAMTLNSGSNLIQGGTTTTNVNYGNITVNRDSNALSRLDYTIWSSPTTSSSFFLKTFSPATLDARFYNYTESTNLYAVEASPTTKTFTKGAGYLIRMPDTAPDAPGTLTFTGQFVGLPTTGTTSKSITYTDATHGYNMVGNPFPSTISAETFLTVNTAAIENTLWFWRKTNGAGGSAYATYTAGGATTTTPTSAAPNGTIQVGQGFFVKAKLGATAISFTNAMRAGVTIAPFFKTKQVSTDRIWLNLTNTSGAFSQALVGYFTDGTLGVDNYDGKYINDSNLALTSNINNEEYTIQGRPAFDATDVVPLNFKTDVTGDYTIAIDHADGLFATGQDVYLVDSKTGTETDLKAGAYTFNAVAGVDNARFSLKYQKTLRVDAPAFNENSVNVYKSNGVLYVNSPSDAIQNIEVFDIQGRLLADQKNVKATSATIKNLKASNQVLIVKITNEENKVVSKKVLN